MEQINMFEEVEYKITKPIRLIELFGGVGSQAMALRNIGVSFEHHRLVEFDKFAIKSYNAIHGTDFPTVDITEVKGKDLGITDTDKYEYMMTYSFPCQDLSVAGKGKGMSRDSGTRSGLLWEVERLLDETEQLPQILLMENVPQVISKKNKSDFDEWLQFLESKGYSNFYEKLNAKNFGVAQNRDRVFMVSILGDYTYVFPKGIELIKTVKNYLEDEVDEKFYINTDKAKQLVSKIDDKYKIDQSAIKVSKQCGKFETVQKDNLVLEPKVAVKQATKKGYIECKIGGVADLSYPDSKTRRGRVQENGDVSPTLTASETGISVIENMEYRIRKLTPKECWRLMGFTDEDFHKAESVCSNTQLYKQAGNSIVVPVLEGIFNQLFKSQTLDTGDSNGENK